MGRFWKIQRGGGVIRKIPSVGGVWIFSGTTHYTCSVLRSRNSRKTVIKTFGFAVVRKSMLCTQNNVFVVDEESWGWGIVSFCMPGGGEETAK